MNPELKRLADKLQAAHTTLKAERTGIANILAACEGKGDEGPRELTAEEHQMVAGARAKITATEAQRDNWQAQHDELAAALEAERHATVYRTAGDSGGLQVRGGIRHTGRASEDDPKKGFKSTQEFFRSVMRQTIGEASDERLKPLATAGSDEGGTYSDPYGGFLVPSGFLPNLMTLAAEGDPTTGRTMQVPMSTSRVEIPARTDKTHSSSVSGGLAVYRRSETQSVTASRMEMEMIAMNATPLMGLSYATEELISDSAISFVALLERGFRDEFAKKILNEKIRGTGVGQMEGVLNTPALISVTGAGGAGEIVFEDVVQMRSQCYGYQNAIWLYNHDCLPQLAQMVLPIGTAGVPMWTTTVINDVQTDMLMGRPAFPTEHCASVGTVGDLILGDWSQYLEGTYQQLESAESMHVRFVNNERTFRFLMRNDGKCWWRSVLTPAQSTTTLSPFVAIGTRT